MSFGFFYYILKFNIFLYSIPYPEENYIYEDLTREEYLKMLEDGSMGTELPSLLCNPHNVDTQNFDSQEFLNEAMDQLVTEEEAMNIDK